MDLVPGYISGEEGSSEDNGAVHVSSLARIVKAYASNCRVLCLAPAGHLAKNHKMSSA